jgi:UDP-glucuronate 4-epimerase
MALFKFTKAILSGENVDVYNYGDMSRDFTYINDLANGIRLLVNAVPANSSDVVGNLHSLDSISTVAPFRVVNIGNSKPENLSNFIYFIEQSVGAETVKNLMPIQAGDVRETWADTSLLENLTG